MTAGRGGPAPVTGGAPGRSAAAPAAFVALDRGTATCAAALVGNVEGRWRLLSAAAVPAGGAAAAPVRLLVDRVRDADPALAAALGLDAPDADPPRVEAAGSPAPTAAVLAATEATRSRHEAAAAAAGWLTVGASSERDDPLVAARIAARPEVECLVVGTSDPAAADERDLVGELVALAAGIAERRPGLPVVLVGAASARGDAFPLGTEIVDVPRGRDDPGAGLRGVLAARRAGPRDPRRALVAATGTLAAILGLRIELLEVGMSGALRVRAEPGAGALAPPLLVSAEAPTAALGRGVEDAALDRVEAWATLAVDRARLRDRLFELGLAPWADLEDDGPLLRAAALRAALERLVAATDAELGGPAPDLVVLAGGAWAAIPAPAAMLVLADALRRPGVVQVAADPARLLAPLGTVDDPDERAGLLRDLAGDALVPVGTLVIPRGARGGRGAGRLRLESGATPVELELAGGGFALVDLPPGQAGTAELAFRSTVDLGARGRRFAVRVTGGLAGLVVDLRGVPLHLPERTDERRDLLVRWERALWPERDR